MNNRNDPEKQILMKAIASELAFAIGKFSYDEHGLKVAQLIVDYVDEQRGAKQEADPMVENMETIAILLHRLEASFDKLAQRDNIIARQLCDTDYVLGNLYRSLGMVTADEEMMRDLEIPSEKEGE